MVTIKNYQQRTTGEGKEFFVLELEGSIQFLTSQTTGKLYASVAKCTIPCTFDEETAKQLIGTRLPGSIQKVPCDSYEYRTPEGDVMTLDYQYTYIATESNQQEHNDSPARKLVSLEVI